MIVELQKFRRRTIVHARRVFNSNVEPFLKILTASFEQTPSDVCKKPRLFLTASCSYDSGAWSLFIFWIRLQAIEIPLADGLMRTYVIFVMVLKPSDSRILM